MHCHLWPPGARRDPAAKLKSFRGFVYELQTKLMPFHLDSPWGATLMPLKACAINWKRNRMLRVDINSDPTVSCLWTKVHEISQQCMGPWYFETLFPDCYYYVSFRRYSPLSFEVGEKANKCKSPPPIFLRETTMTFVRKIVTRFTARRLAEFG